MKPVSVLALVVLGVSAAGCATARLKVPEAVKSTPELRGEGYSSGLTLKQKDMKIGSYDVINIDRDWDKGSSAGVGPWQRDSKKKSFRYDVKAQGRVIHAECSEQAVQNSVGGWSKGKVTFG